MSGVRETPPLAGGGWSSSLSVAEAAALRQAGFEARGLVMGSSVYHLGVDYSPYGGYGYSTYGYPGRPRGWIKVYSPAELGYGGGAPWAGATRPNLGGQPWGMMGVAPMAVSWERVVFERGIEEAASLATSRLVAEASALAAHGVVGVRLAFRYLPEMGRTVEFTALGTAVVRPGAPPVSPPFTSHLDGQSLPKLLDAGLVPVAVAVGAGSVRADMPRPMLTGRAADLAPFGDAIEVSRRIAADHLAAPRGHRGWAVVGTLASTGQDTEGEGEIATTVLTGTVVRRFAPPATDRPPLPIMRLSRP